MSQSTLALDLPVAPVRGIADAAEAAAFVQAIFDREMGVTLNNAKAGSKRDDAMRELTKEAANLYSRRVLREMIQNAYDGARTALAPRILLRLDLSDGPNGAILVANNGNGFTVDNVDAISNPAMSNKTAGNFIGHKGLGFRSVELLSDDVQIFSKRDPAASRFDGFCFRFAAPADERAWLDNAREAAMAPMVVGRVHRLQLPLPLSPSGPAVEALAAQGFSTVIRLPLRDAVAAGRASEEMRLLVDEKAPMTLFLDRLESLMLETIDATGQRDSKELRRTSKESQTSPFGRSLTIEEVAVDRHRYLVGRMAVDEAGFRASVEEAVAANHPVERWREWQGAPSVSVALPLSQEARVGTFYAFLPMDTVAPFNGCLDAPFYPNANRRDLDLDNPLNAFLLDSVAELCLAVARTIAASDTTSLAYSAAAVDALAWAADPGRLFDACERAALPLGDLLLPAVRRGNDQRRWARLADIYDWTDADHRIIDSQWLVRACGVAMLRRSLGTRRIEALKALLEDTDFQLEPQGATIARWVPLLASDLAGRRRKATKQNWEDFYHDVAATRAALPHLKGAVIFRLEDGSLGAANAPDNLGERELFISADPEHATRQRKRLAGTSLFPPKAVAKRMQFADPALFWPQAVTAAFVSAGLATDYSLPRVIAGMGRLLGKRPARQTALAAINWAFGAWMSHKSTEVERALRAAQLPVPTAAGRLRPAGGTRFGAGWRGTQGGALQELCDAVGPVSRPAKTLCDSLLASWEAWPLRERGTAADWVQFLGLLGVKDGLTPLLYKAETHWVSDWIGLRRGYGEALTIEARLGPSWRAALKKVTRAFGYQSGNYSTDETLFALPLQAEHAAMSDRAKQAYARLVVAMLADLDQRYFTTILSRTSGMSDTVPWPSPLQAFLTDAAWLPVMFADELSWKTPAACWFAPRGDSLPYFLPRLERPIREAIEGSVAVREALAGRLGLRLWNDRVSAPARLDELGQTLARGIAEHEHVAFRSEYRQAWTDWHELDPRPALGASLTLAVQVMGRLAAYVPDKADPQTLFVSGGADPTLDNLLMALGHRLLSVPPGTAKAAADALAARDAEMVRLADAVTPRIIVDGEELDLAAERPRLVAEGRNWLAEIAVLALEFHNSAINRSTPRSRQALYDDFRRLRLVRARDVAVEIDGRTGPLPDMLAGVLPVPHAERPTILVESAGGDLDWPMLGRLASGIALALSRAWLLTDFRMAFLAIGANQPMIAGTLTPPDDEAVAAAFCQPVARVREIQRALRAGSRRIMDWLAPIVGAVVGLKAAQALLDREASLVEDDDIVIALMASGADADTARALVTACREAEGLDELRRKLGVGLAAFNAACAALGPRFPPLRFERALTQAFEDRVDERRASLADLVRDAFAASDPAAIDLAAYRAALALDWITFDPGWVETHDALDDAVMDARMEALAVSALPASSGTADASVDTLRQRNRATLAAEAERIRRVVAAWVAKVPGRSLPGAWTAKAEAIVRDALATGAFDFASVAPDDLPAALAHGGLWPAGMPATTALDALGLVADDLDQQARAEQRRRDDDARRDRTMTFGGVPVEGGESGSFQKVADALAAGLASKAFQTRSGPAELRPFPEGDDRAPRKRGRSEGGKDPSFLTDAQRDLIGFAGEYAAYVHLQRTVRNFADEHWISSIGRRYLCLKTIVDRGYDFHVPRSRGGLYYEVKGHTGDPKYVDLERSQVEAAVQFADERQGIWKILYISHVLDPHAITVHELANPFSEGNMRLFRPSSRQGVRLLIDRA